jgi:hypothetical protein
LAVPALQRTARNTQRKNDVATLVGSVNQFVDDNNGDLPTGATFATGTVTITGVTGTDQPVTSKAGYYLVAPDVDAYAAAPSFGFVNELHHGGLTNSFKLATAGGVKIGPDQWAIVTGAVCNGNISISAGTAREFVVMYELETASSTSTTGGTTQCQQS